MTTNGCNQNDPPSDDAWFTARRWSNRMLVFTDHQPGAGEQRTLLMGNDERLLDRDLLSIELGTDQATLLVGNATDLPGSTAFRDRYRIPSDRFAVVLVGKDGLVKERRDQPMDPEELWSIIDAMPMRIDEMNRDRR